MTAAFQAVGSDTAWANWRSILEIFSTKPRILPPKTALNHTMDNP